MLLSSKPPGRGNLQGVRAGVVYGMRASGGCGAVLLWNLRREGFGSIQSSAAEPKTAPLSSIHIYRYLALFIVAFASLLIGIAFVLPAGDRLFLWLTGGIFMLLGAGLSVYARLYAKGNRKIQVETDSG